MDAGRRTLSQQPGDQVGEPAVVVVVQQSGQGVPAVDQQQHVRGPLRLRQGGAQLVQSGRVPFAAQLLTSRQLCGEPVQQAFEAFLVVPGDDRPAVRQGVERGQSAAGRVDAVQVDVRAGGRPGHRAGQGAQHLGPAGAGAPITYRWPKEARSTVATRRCWSWGTSSSA